MPTIVELLDKAFDEYGDQIAIKDHVHYREYTYSDMQDEVDSRAAYLMDHGIEKGDRVVILGENDSSVLLTKAAIMKAGGVAVPIDESRPDHVIDEIINKIEPKMILSQGKFVEKLNGREHICFEELAGFQDTRSRDFPTIEDDDLATILISSGSTSSGNGIMLSHNNIAQNGIDCGEVIDITPGEKYFAGLAQHWHSFANMVQMSFLASGLELHFTNRRGFLAGSGAEINPNYALMIPSLANKIMGDVYKSFEEKKLKTVLAAAIANSTQYFRKLLHEQVDVGWRRVLHEKADANIYSQIREKLHERLGEDLNMLIGGSAELNPKTQEFFYCIGIPIFQGYGLTETAPVISVNTHEFYRFGSSGIVLPSIEIKIMDFAGENDITQSKKPGLIYVRGPNVFEGYFKDKEKTRGVLFEDGWFNTKDTAVIEKDQGQLFLYFHGRAESYIRLSGGEGEVPERFESRYENQGDFRRIVVVGQNRKALGAIGIPNEEYMQLMGEGKITNAAAVKALKKLLKKSKKELGRALPHLAVLDQFDASKYETTTGKLRRNRFLEDHQSIIDSMYPSSKD
tara:strand:+ start:4910 stop:6619 length:1710 start_codon:yes stop_codon:yes gene_type:complete